MKTFITLRIVCLVGLSASLLACIGGEDSTDLDEEQLEDVDSTSEEAVNNYNLGSAMGSPVITGNTCGAFNQYTPSCASSNASDNAYYWTAPYNGTFTFTTAGSSFDTILMLRNAANTTTLACNDDSGGTLQSSVTVALSAGQQIIIVIDGYSTSCGASSLNIAGSPSCNWTQWYDRDDPSGNGDYETRVDQIPAVCASPSAVECKTTGGVDWTQTGEVVTCTPSQGFYCVNSSQPDGYCQDYIVRFCCP